MGSGSVVWLGAHPDDELYVAPWLAQLCIEEHAKCRFLVMTHGEAGGCKLAQGCLPDLETVRQAELTASAALFGAEVLLWDYGDGTSGTMDGVAANWGSTVGGADALVALVASELQGAERVVTFDPRHGDSCHADHRAAGAVAIAAAEQAGLSPSQVTLVASRLVTEPAVPDDASLWSFDASVPLSETGLPAWQMLVDVLSTHSSQFSSDEVASIEAVSPMLQRTWLLNLSDAQVGDSRYEDLCP